MPETLTTELERRLVLAEMQYDLLQHESRGHTEIRAINGVTRSYFYGNKQDYLQGVANLIREGIPNLYIGIAPRSRANGSGESVENFTCLVLDLDPVTPNPSIEDSAYIVSKAVQARVGPIVVSSGSGAHIYIPVVPVAVNVSNRSLISGAVRNWGTTLFPPLLDPKIKLDAIFDLPRVIRLWGSTNSRTGRTCIPVRIDRQAPLVPWDWSAHLIGPVGAPRPLSEPIGPSISNGGRNSTLTSLAGTMRRRGMSEEAIREALIVENNTKCSPPLPSAEVIRIASSVSRYTPTPDNAVNPVPVRNEPRPTTRLVSPDATYFTGLTSRKPGIMSGFHKLDEMLSGFKKQQMYIVGARPNEGKTTLITQLLYSFARSGKRCLYFPTELGAEPIYDKIISSETGVPLKKFQNGEFSPDEGARIFAIKESFSRLPLTIAEDFGLTIDKVKVAIEEHKPDVVALDYIQALKWREGSPQEIGKAARGLKELCCDYDIPLIVGSQLNRNDEKPNDLGRVKGSGAIEELADVMMYLWSVNKIDQPRIVDLCVVKSRYSATGNIQLNFFSSVAKFKET